MERYQQEARQRQIDFHLQEIREGPHREPPMPEAQVRTHREQLALHAGKQAIELAAKDSQIPDNIVLGEE